MQVCVTSLVVDMQYSQGAKLVAYIRLLSQPSLIDLLHGKHAEDSFCFMVNVAFLINQAWNGLKASLSLYLLAQEERLLGSKMK